MCPNFKSDFELDFILNLIWADKRLSEGVLGQKESNWITDQYARILPRPPYPLPALP